MSLNTVQTRWHSSRRAEGAIPGRQVFESNALFQCNDLRSLTKEKPKARLQRRRFSQPGLLRLFLLELSQVLTSLLPHARHWSPTQPHCGANTQQPLWEWAPWGQPPPSQRWSSPVSCCRHQFCFRMRMGKRDQSVYWEPPLPTGWVWAGLPSQPIHSLMAPLSREGRQVCPPSWSSRQW